MFISHLKGVKIMKNSSYLYILKFGGDLLSMPSVFFILMCISFMSIKVNLRTLHEILGLFILSPIENVNE